ncbi:hypothetical protein [Paraburkholderia saeva]|uniref:TRAPPC10/Trs130 C-terminal domain-containing protein n=1 Tax=Paraburkholderia saeva TaxID=2777537 RepID=A0A9N8RZX1_9BURK|nr:hypothetical protein [Paraburkholderia saeva]CAG4906358.1 hypothetical protein R52603_03417 [Paraburkholderia saeva]CAG4910322.1 hypothetical protein LMG31841_03959 [Paraburkholderia saeva]CAG4927898.1 hypothetical protein R70241_05653 [Paraburkholderia saeva]
MSSVKIRYAIPPACSRLVALALPLMMSVACASGAGAVSVGAPVELSGKLVLRGNEPFVYPVVYDARGVWELQGVPKAQASVLQNQQVSVQGTVTRLDPGGFQLPAVQVKTLVPKGASSN